MTWANNLSTNIFLPEIVFTDETSIWLHDNDGKGWFHKSDDAYMLSDRYSGKIHVFGAISMLEGKIAIHTFRENLNAELYSNILSTCFLPHANQLLPNGYIF